ncbi:MAG: type II secretion system F family protein [Actinomycetes bacterium]
MNSVLVPIMAAVLAFGAVLVGAFAFAEQRRRSSMRHTLAVVLGGPDAETDVLGHRTWSETSAIDAIVEALGSRLISARGRERLRHQLALAGRPVTEPLKTVIGRKIIYLGVGLCLGFIAALMYGGWLWLLVPLAAAVGFFLPDMVLYNQGEHRTEEIKLELPDALDLLNLCVESGLGLQAALAKVAESQHGPVAQEFGRVLQEMQLGVSRSAAFESMANRTKQQDLQRFVSAMLQVDKLGIPVASVLREQAREMRAARHSRAREQAQKVPVKILGPLMICFLPGLFVIILGPAAINTMNVLSGR